jgi:hypothetical protein
MFDNLSLIVDYGETPPKVPDNSNFSWEKKRGKPRLRGAQDVKTVDPQGYW